MPTERERKLQDDKTAEHVDRAARDTLAKMKSDAKLSAMTNIGFLPGGARMLVEEIVAEKTKGGIIRPATAVDARAKNLAIRCKVLAIGVGLVHVTPDGQKIRVGCDEIIGQRVAVGSILFCSRFWGDYEIETGDGAPIKLKIVAADEVLGVEEQAA